MTEDFLTKLQESRDQKADIQALRDAAVKTWGGPEGLMKKLKREFNRAKEGSSTRQRIITFVTDVIMEASKADDENDVVEEYSTEQLQAALKAAVHES